MSLIEVGTPSSGPSGSPFCQRASDNRAAASAPSRSTRLKALTFGLTASMRSSTAHVASTGDSVFARYAATSSVADHQ